MAKLVKVPKNSEKIRKHIVSADQKVYHSKHNNLYMSVVGFIKINFLDQLQYSQFVVSIV